MQINNILAGYSDPAAPGNRAQPAQSNPGPLLANLASQAQSTSAPSAALRDVFARYDVTDITPCEFSEMLRELHDLGAISDQELQNLALVRIDLDQDGIDPDDSLNLVDYYAAKLQRAEQVVDEGGGRTSGDACPSKADLALRLDWMKKLALIQSAPDEMGLDIAV